MRRLLADVADRGAEFLGSGRNRLFAHRGVAGSFLRGLDAAIGLARDARQLRRGGSHLVGGAAEVLQGFADQTFERADMGLVGTLTRGGFGVALTLLSFDGELLLRLALARLQSAGQCADLVLPR